MITSITSDYSECNHLAASPGFSRFRVTQFLALCVCFVDRCLSFCTFSFGHCVARSSLIYGFWLPRWYLLPIVLPVLLWYTDSDYPLVSFAHCVICSSLIYGFWLPLWYLLPIVLSVLLWYTDSDYPFGIFCPLCCPFFFDIRILITPLVSSYSSSSGNDILFFCLRKQKLFVNTAENKENESFDDKNFQLSTRKYN